MSSGGAMTSVMLATYPEVFAGGAIIAGLPYHSATNMMEAMVRMNGYGSPSDRQLDALVRDASKFTGPWPTISVWHGDSDTTVDNSNASSIVRQWQKIHKVEGPLTHVEMVDGYPREVWCDADGRVVIEHYIIGDMGHGTPISAEGDEGLGEEGKYMLEVGISSTRHIADFWGLTQSGAANRAAQRTGRSRKPRRRSDRILARRAAFRRVLYSERRLPRRRGPLWHGTTTLRHSTRPCSAIWP